MTSSFKYVRRKAILGASLFEALVLVAILGAVGSLAALSLARPAALVLDQSKSNLVQELRLAGLRARSTGATTTVFFDADTRRLKDAEGATLVQIAPAIEVVATGAELTTVSRRASEIAIQFYPDGQTSGASFQLSGGQRMAEVRVHWLTGHVDDDEG